jgi:hypothetical protein
MDGPYNAMKGQKGRKETEGHLLEYEAAATDEVALGGVETRQNAN